MARRCTLCEHPDRIALDKALISGMPFRRVAARFSVSSSAAFRHKRDHLPKVLAKGMHSSAGKQDAYTAEIFRFQKEKVAEETRHAIDAFQQLRAINSACLEVLTKARAAGKHSTLLRAADRVAKHIDLQARLLGEIQDAPTVNVLVMPEWQNLRQLIVEALRPFPEARLAVSKVIESVSAGS